MALNKQKQTTVIQQILFAISLFSLALLGGCDAYRDDNGELKLPEPMTYEAAAEDQLGVNENGKGLEVGTEIPDLNVLDIYGNDYTLSDAWSEKPALVVFYRGGWCPLCNTQVRELSMRFDDLSAAGVQPVLLSVDAPDKSSMVEAQYDIPFPVLSDQELAAHKAFNVVLTLDKKTLLLYRGFGLVPSEWSGRDHNAIAVASAFIVDTDGKVLMSHAPEDYKTRPSVDQLIQLIRKVGI